MSDVFISHSTKDKEIADGIVDFLESRGISCWIAPRNIVPGSDWAASISTAITASKIFLLIYSENSASSEQVPREISLAESTRGVTVVPYKTDDAPLSGTYQYYLTGAHWIAADAKKKDFKYEELYMFLAGILGKNTQIINAETYINEQHIYQDGTPVTQQSGSSSAPAAAPETAAVPASGTASAPSSAPVTNKVDKVETYVNVQHIHQAGAPAEPRPEAVPEPAVSSAATPKPMNTTTASSAAAPKPAASTSAVTHEPASAPGNENWIKSHIPLVCGLGAAAVVAIIVLAFSIAGSNSTKNSTSPSPSQTAVATTTESTDPSDSSETDTPTQVTPEDIRENEHYIAGAADIQKAIKTALADEDAFEYFAPPENLCTYIFFTGGDEILFQLEKDEPQDPKYKQAALKKLSDEIGNMDDALYSDTDYIYVAEIFGSSISVFAYQGETKDFYYDDTTGKSNGILLTEGFLSVYKLNIREYECIGTYYGALDADGIPNGEGNFFGYCDENMTSYISYIGDFVDGLCNGQGKLVLEDDEGTETYEGDFKDGKYNGQGKLVAEFDDQTVTYEGDFKDGKYNGQGKMVVEFDEETDTYEGDFKDDKYNGQGKMVVEYAKGVQVYEGEYVDDLRNGQGKMVEYDTSGNVTSTYEGEYVDGKRNGQGKWVEYDTSGNVTSTLEGTFKDGEFIGEN